MSEPLLMLVVSPCPNCGDRAARRPYDIGSGPELCCGTCEWCWGRDGQDLKPLEIPAMLAEAYLGLAQRQAPEEQR